MISSAQLAAFFQIAKMRNFSKSAKALRISQPALSHRIKNLELHLQTSLFIRDPSGIKLTAAGEKLLRYCQAKEQIEHELLQDLIDSHRDQGGTIRIGAFSSVMRSIVMPAIAPLLKTDPFVHIELQNHEMRDMVASLEKSEVDIILTSEPSRKTGLITKLLGYEENVLTTARNIPCPEDIFLDHDSDDPTTMAFFRQNELDTSKIKRRYLDEVYALIDGVKLGYGRSILPKHLVKNDLDLEIIGSRNALKIPVYMQYFEQPFYAGLQKKVVTSLESACKSELLT